MEAVENIPTQEEANRLAEPQQYLDAGKAILDACDVEGPYFIAMDAGRTFGEHWAVFETSEDKRVLNLSDWVEGWSGMFKGDIDEQTFELQTRTLTGAVEYLLAKQEFEDYARSIAEPRARSYKFREES